MRDQPARSSVEEAVVRDQVQSIELTWPTDSRKRLEASDSLRKIAGKTGAKAVLSTWPRIITLAYRWLAPTVEPAASAKQKQDQKNNQNRFQAHCVFLSAKTTCN